MSPSVDCTVCVFLPRILSIECIDVDVNTGRHSPLFAWMISSGEDLAMQW